MDASPTDKEPSEQLDKVNQLLDKLTLDSLILIERQIQNKINLENSMIDGELHLAKSRYIMGHRSVSAMQLPNHSEQVEIDPIVTVEEVRDEDMFGQINLKLQTEKQSDVDNTEHKNLQNPVKWFGVLVPNSLHLAQARFKSAISWSVDCVNTQLRLRESLIKINQLKQFKEKL